MSIDEITPKEWDKIFSEAREARHYENRPYPREVKKLEEDNVNRPQHYTVGPVEVIDIIRQQQGSAIEFHYEAALLKYVLRWRYKNGVEDLEKARVYLDWLIEQKKSEQGG